MRVLFTGASSFTGAWLVRALVEAGVSVVAPLRGPLDDGDRLRSQRLAMIAPHCRLIPEAPFGSELFLDLCRGGDLDLLCHHGAEVGEHRRPGFDPLAACATNTRQLDRVLDLLMASGTRAVLATGSVFEADEGQGEQPLRACSAYGLSKTLTWQVLRYACERRSLRLAKAVIAAPFGPLEKDNFCASLTRAWLLEITPLLQRPQLVRDHVPVAWLARAYAGFALRLAEGNTSGHLCPSAFPYTLAGFARHLAEALRPRLGRPCELRLADPPDPTDEPRTRRGFTACPELGQTGAINAMWDEYAAASVQRWLA